MKVLLVDDDRSTRYLIGRVLIKRFGCEVTEAGDGRQALEALSHDRFHLAFLDVQMPVMDGLETLRTLRESPEHAALQVVMLTGERDETIIRKILELGVFEYMVKPLNMARLADRLRRMLRTIIAQRDGAPTEPGWFGQALRHIDAPLLIIEGRTPFRRCFAETFGVHRPVIEAESGVSLPPDPCGSNWRAMWEPRAERRPISSESTPAWSRRRTSMRRPGRSSSCSGRAGPRSTRWLARSARPRYSARRAGIRCLATSRA